MNKKTQSAMLKAAGATFAVCSAAAFMGSKSSAPKSAKKAVKTAVDKMADFAETVTSMM
ncbi:MAG: hypothetical protein IJ851_01195 [Eubacterium sp.]|nr:hypothetical protein [Eubacterium sp.]